MITNEKQAPYDHEAEQAVLGSIFYDNSSLDDVTEKVETPNTFFLISHQLIYTAILELNQDNKPVDEILVSDILKHKKQLAECGGLSYISSLVDCSPEIQNIGNYIDIILDKFRLRELLKISGETTKIEGKKADDAIDESLSKLTALSESLVTSERLKPIKSILLNAFGDLEKASENKDGIIGLSTGFVDIDRMTLGLHKTDLIIIAGRPSTGKTALALNISQHIAEFSQDDILLFSYEMGDKQLAMRLAGSMARIDTLKLRNGNLDQDEWDRLALAADRLSRMPLFIDETMPTLEQMVAISRKQARKKKIGMIVIDYLQLMPVSKKHQSREQEVAAISRSMKRLAKELDCPVVALSQLNRSLESRSDKRPQLSDLRESGSLEQDPDIIMFIYRDEVYNENSPDKGIAEINIAKHRNGATGTIRLSFKGKYTKFYNFMGDRS